MALERIMFTGILCTAYFAAWSFQEVHSHQSIAEDSLLTSRTRSAERQMTLSTAQKRAARCHIDALRDITWANCTLQSGSNRTESLFRMLLDVTEILETYGVKHSIFGGTLLGQMRSGTMNPWEVDNDIILPDRHQQPAAVMTDPLRLGLCSHRLVLFEAQGVWRVCRMNRNPGPPAPPNHVLTTPYLYTDIYDRSFMKHLMMAQLQNSWSLAKYPIGDQGHQVYRFNEDFAVRWLVMKYGPLWHSSVPSRGQSKRGQGPVPMPGITPDWVK